MSVGECWDWVPRGSLSCDGGDGLRLDTTISYKKMGKCQIWEMLVLTDCFGDATTDGSRDADNGFFVPRQSAIEGRG